MDYTMLQQPSKDAWWLSSLISLNAQWKCLLKIFQDFESHLKDAFGLFGVGANKMWRKQFGVEFGEISFYG